jgi:hypothetical protein
MKRLLFGIMFALIMAGICVDAAADWDGLKFHQLEFDPNTRTGRVLATWTGEHPLSYYENEWIPYSVSTDKIYLAFDAWVTMWIGVCEPPCDIQAEFILRNVKEITK